MCGEVLILSRPMQTALRQLTPKQHAFADALLDGVSPSNAYRRAYQANGSPRVVSVKAAEVKKHAAVQEYVRHQQDKLDRTIGLTREHKRQLLYQIVMDPDSSPADKIKAIQLDNRMTGDDRSEKAESFGMGDLMALVRQGSEQPSQLN